MEATTIAVKPETLEMLRKTKEETHAESVDVVIRQLLLRSKKPAKSMFGVLHGMKKEFKREEIDRFS